MKGVYFEGGAMVNQQDQVQKFTVTSHRLTSLADQDHCSKEKTPTDTDYRIEIIWEASGEVENFHLLLILVLNVKTSASDFAPPVLYIGKHP